MTLQTSGAMRLINELFELKTRVDDLFEFVKGPVCDAEVALIKAQAEAMKIYAQMLGARLHLLNGTAPS